MFDFLKDRNYFNEDEKTLLNHIAENVEQNEFCNKLSFAMAASEDEECIDIMRMLLMKIQKFSAEEWNDLQNYLPFDVTVSDDDFLFSELEVEEV